MTGFGYFIWGGEVIYPLRKESGFILYHFSIQHEHYARASEG